MAGRFIHDAEDLTRLKEAWNKLCLAQKRPNAMLSWDWIVTWWNVYGASEPASSLEVWVDEIGGDLRAVFPAYGINDGAGKQIRFMGTGEAEADAVCADYLSPLVGSDGFGLPPEICATWLKDPKNDLMLSDMTVGEGVSEKLVEDLNDQGYLVRKTSGSTCPFLKLPASYDDLLASFSSNFRSQVKQSEKAWKELGDPRVRWVERSEDIEPFWNDLVKLHQERQQSLGRPGVFSSPKFFSFHREIVDRFFHQGWLRAAVLEAGGKPAAVVYAFSFGGTVFFYQSGTAVDVPPKLRPGLLLHLQMMRRAIELKDKEYDFLRGDDPYKRRFTDTNRRLFHIEAGKPTVSRRLRFCALAVKDRLRRLR